MTSYSTAPEWQWSEDHQDYYYVTPENGAYHYHWLKQQTSPPSSTGAAPAAGNHGRVDSVAPMAQMAPGVPPNMRPTVPNLMSGTPDRGWYDLDPSYRMRTNVEAHQFFKRGRVFAMLWAETASETMVRNGSVNSAITYGRFNQGIYSQIRRFVIVQVPKDRNFVKACAITTYGRRGVLKPGCNASEHSVVYFSGTQPMYFQNERERGMTKDPIEINPCEPNSTMEPTSRLRFGKTYPIEWNVKVKDIGKVVSRDMPKLLSYWQEEDQRDYTHEPEYNDDEEPDQFQAFQPTQSSYPVPTTYPSRPSFAPASYQPRYSYPPQQPYQAQSPYPGQNFSR